MPLRSVAIRKAALILADSLGRPAEAAALLAAALEGVAPEAEPVFFAETANAWAALLHGYLYDAPGAEAATRRVLALEGACPAIAYAAAVDRLAALHTDAGRADEAAAAQLLVLSHPALPAAGFSLKLIGSGASPVRLEEAVVLFRRRMAAPFATTAEQQTRLERVQPEVVELLLALGRADEAVRECRAYAFAASDRAYPLSIELAARCLKALDGDLGRANALLAFHGAAGPASGAGNHLLDFPALEDPERVEAARQLERPPVDWTGWLNRAAQLGWLDRPADSMDAARIAFAGCPMVSNSLQACANAVARPVLVATRDAELGQRLVDFLLMGPAGPDGRVGTDDDMVDPFPEARRRLAFKAMAPLADSSRKP